MKAENPLKGAVRKLLNFLRNSVDIMSRIYYYSGMKKRLKALPMAVKCGPEFRRRRAMEKTIEKIDNFFCWWILGWWMMWLCYSYYWLFEQIFRGKP